MALSDQSTQPALKRAIQQRMRPMVKYTRLFRHALSVLWSQGYQICYIVGLRTYLTGRRLVKSVLPLIKPAFSVFRRGFHWLVRHTISPVVQEIRRIRQGFAIAKNRLSIAWRKHPLVGLYQLLMLPLLALRRHRRALATLLNLAAPVAAAFFLMTTIQHWTNVNYALSLEYKGQQLGYIADESIFDSALNMAVNRVINTDDTFHVVTTPKLTLEVVPQPRVLTEAELCDKILFSSSDSIAQVSGLYVDEQFMGAVPSRLELDDLLQSMLDSHRTGAANEQVSFVQSVDIVDGLYPLSSVISVEEMREKLTRTTVVAKYYTVVSGDSPSRIARLHNMSLDELRRMNPDLESLMYPDKQVMVQKPQSFLSVKVTRTITYDENIPFTVIQQEDNSRYTGSKQVKTKGVPGVKKVTAQVTLIDGTETERVILSEQVTKQPVNEVVLVGTKKRPAAPRSEDSVPASAIIHGDGIATGRFCYPVPAVTNIYRGYSRGHRALDFSSGKVPIRNQPIVAVDGGTVVEVCNYTKNSYGKYIVIDHGGGLQTLYAHCSSVNVVKGQKVTKGQMIGRVGSTGRSTGPHLHFELRKNGVQVNPVPYFK